MRSRQNIIHDQSQGIHPLFTWFMIVIVQFTLGYNQQIQTGKNTDKLTSIAISEVVVSSILFSDPPEIAIVIAEIHGIMILELW